MVIRTLAAMEDDAPCTEWALNIDVSIPQSWRTSFSHRVMVLEVAALWGLITVKNSVVSFPLIVEVFLSYSLRAHTGHSSCFSGQDGKKKLCMGFLHLDCLAKLVGVNCTPSILKDLVLSSSFDRSADLQGRGSTISMTVFHVNCHRVYLLLSPWDSM